jgi:hypothetical protein
VWVAGDDGYRADAAAFLGHRHDLGIGRRDVVARERERFGPQHASPRGGLDGQRRVDVVLCADGLYQAIDQCIGASLPGSHLGKHRDRNQERSIEALFEQVDICSEQIPIGRPVR